MLETSFLPPLYILSWDKFSRSGEELGFGEFGIEAFGDGGSDGLGTSC